jgi:hypothetical protein
MVREGAGEHWGRRLLQELEGGEREDARRPARAVAVNAASTDFMTKSRNPDAIGPLRQFITTSEAGSDTGSDRSRIDSMKL